MPLNKKAMLLLLLLASAKAQALHTCGVTMVVPISFNYDSSKLSETNTVGKLGVECTLIGGLPETVAYNVLLSRGANGNYLQRELANGNYRLQYNLYKDNAHTAIWGDNTSGYTGLSDAYILSTVSALKEYSVYLKSPARQSVSAGVYTDLIMVTVEY